MHDPLRFRTLIEDGLLASQQRDPERALALFRQAQDEDPDSGLPAFLIGSELAACGRIDEAEAALATAVLLAPGFALARYQLGLLQFSTDRAGAALVTWQPLAGLPADDPLGHFVRGFIALTRQDHPQALAHFETGLTHAQGQEALAADIRLVVQAVQALPAAPDAASAPPGAGRLH